jgi:hypothetical protein
MVHGLPLELLKIAPLALFLSAANLWADDDKDGIEFFEKRIRPILVDHCYKCHSEKAEKLEGGLYVDSRDGLLTGGDRGPAIEVGEPERSLLIEAVKYEMDDLKMPPDRRLEDSQIADLAKWIKIGLPYPKKPEKNTSPGRRGAEGPKRRVSRIIAGTNPR